jgi:hypothetical protein
MRAVVTRHASELCGNPPSLEKSEDGAPTFVDKSRFQKLRVGHPPQDDGVKQTTAKEEADSLLRCGMTIS